MKKTFFTALLISGLFLGCKETTTSPIITDIASVAIETPNFSKIYPAGETETLYATVTHTDGSTGDASETMTWTSSDSSIISVSRNIISGGYKNSGGDVNITVSYNDFNDTVTLSAAKAVDFNITSSTEVNATGTYDFQANVTYDDLNTGIVYRNILWDMNNSATYETTDGVTKITLYSGTTEVNATLFPDDNETNLTQSLTFTIN